MWLLIVIGVAIGAFGTIWLGFVPPLNAKTLLRIQNSTVLVKRGQLRPHAKDSTTEVLRCANVTRGFIAIVPGPCVKFSRSIPPAIHQRLRNILLNQ